MNGSYVLTIPVISSLQTLTCLPSKCWLLSADVCWQIFRFLPPLWTSSHLWQAAFVVKSCAVLTGQDVLDEEGCHRFDCVRHFHPVIQEPDASQYQKADWAGWGSVCPHTLTRSEFIQVKGRVHPCERGGPTMLNQLLLFSFNRLNW